MIAQEEGNITNKYLRGINLIASDIEGTTNYYLYNGHGDVVQLTQTNGTITKNYDYDAFGIEKDIDQNDTNPFRYCGEYYDTETGTIYLRARYYDPSVGRFITEDSYLGKIEDPLSLNLYVYCANNPIMLVDPSGNSGEAATWTGTMWWLCAVDGPIPAGDLIYGVGVLATGAYEYGPAVVNNAPQVIDGMKNIGEKTGEAIKKGYNKLKDFAGGGNSSNLDPNKFDKVANIGKSYGKFGKVIQEAPYNKITGINDVHAVNRAIERGIKPDTILNTVRNPQVVLSQWQGERFAYVTDKTTVILNKAGEIVTVWAREEYTDTVLKVLQEAVK